jgi:hypothetical protein
MEKIMMLWDEMDDVLAMAPRVLAAVAGIGLIVAAALVNRF